MNSNDKLTRKNSSALVLNVAGEAYDIWSWEESIKAWITGDAIVLHEYEDLTIRTGHGVDGISKTFNAPSVILVPNAPAGAVTHVTTLPPTPENLLRRQGGKCCYCGVPINRKTGTKEHVHPQSKGGGDTWDNLRMACQPCNHEKGDKSLEEMGWELEKLSAPRLSKSVSKFIINKMVTVHETWRPYINWDVSWD